ncbi:MAG: hypothetical protein IRY91_17610, partial [Gemmatimonadaceae bacterium]|nr:hypothetical protein [Gemmatimonadaceae bacterium]
MFTTLIESKHKGERKLGGASVSVIIHAALIALLVAVTADAGQKAIKEHRQEDVKFVEVKKEPPPPEPEKPPPP